MPHRSDATIDVAGDPRLADSEKRTERARLALEVAQAEMQAAEAAASAERAKVRLAALSDEYPSAEADLVAADAATTPNDTARANHDADASSGAEPVPDVELGVAPGLTASSADEVAAATGDDERTASRGRLAAIGAGVRGFRAFWAATVIVLVAAAGVLIGVGVDQRLDHRSAVSAAAGDAAAVAMARNGVQRMLSIDQKSVDADVKAILADATGAWRADFSQRSASFASVVRDADVTTTGTIKQAGIERRNSDGSHVVAVSASSQVTNAAGARQEPRNWRMRVTVVPTDQGDKISKMEFVA